MPCGDMHQYVTDALFNFCCFSVLAYTTSDGTVISLFTVLLKFLVNSTY